MWRSWMRLSHEASTRPTAMRAARKQPKQEQKEHSAQVDPLPRSARAQQAAEDQAQIEPCNVDQLTLEDVVMFPQMSAPHTSGVVAVRKATFHQFAASLQ